METLAVGRVLRLREDAHWYAPLHIEAVYADADCCGRIYLKGCLQWEGVNDKGFLAPLREGVALADALQHTALVQAFPADSKRVDEKEHLLWGPSRAAIEELCAAPFAPLARAKPALSEVDSPRGAATWRAHRGGCVHGVAFMHCIGNFDETEPVRQLTHAPSASQMPLAVALQANGLLSIL